LTLPRDVENIGHNLTSDRTVVREAMKAKHLDRKFETSKVVPEG
jgi:hypothetical protein